MPTTTRNEIAESIEAVERRLKGQQQLHELLCALHTSTPLLDYTRSKIEELEQELNAVARLRRGSRPISRQEQNQINADQRSAVQTPFATSPSLLAVQDHEQASPTP